MRSLFGSAHQCAYVYYYISLSGQSVVRHYFPLSPVFKQNDDMKFVALGNKHDNGRVVKEFCDGLKENGAHIVGDYLYVDAPMCNLNNWICAISPSL